MLAAFIIAFLILWTIIGVGALVLIVKGLKTLNSLKLKLRELDDIVNQVQIVARPIYKNKTLIIGLLGVLTTIVSIFKKRKRKE